MPRQKRSDEAGIIYHALNRGNDRNEIFKKPEDYDAFIRIVDEGLQKYPVELFSFSLMPNHWHLVLRPRKDG
ncbi:transposase [Allorhodopirellula solitaria]|nr:transposase [Allorhodopirellula solitaria]TWT75092.1 Transposase IS200 like protein [Allorhodopirellula solitaria]